MSAVIDVVWPEPIAPQYISTWRDKHAVSHSELLIELFRRPHVEYLVGKMSHQHNLSFRKYPVLVTNDILREYIFKIKTYISTENLISYPTILLTTRWTP